MRIAVVGAGRMGRAHLAALERCEHARAVAIVDPDPGARARAGLPGFAEVDELLAAGGFDAVVIAAPTDLHLDLVRKLAGFPVLCEKPCGLTAAEAAAAADAGGERLRVGYWRRFVPSLQRLRAAPLGEPLAVICHQWDEAAAAGFRERSGGIAIDMAVHEIDQVRWLLGQEFGEVSAAGADSSGDPDVAVAVGRLSAGAVATITLGRRFPPGDSCWVELFAARRLERIEFMTSEGDFLAALAAQADAFATGAPGAAGGADAVAALRVAERIGAALSPAPAAAAR